MEEKEIVNEEINETEENPEVVEENTTVTEETQTSQE